MLVKVRRDGPRGWHLIARAKYDADPDAYVRVDDDGNPVKGDPDLAELRQAYSNKFGKKPFGGWGANEIRAKLAE
jgi:hypothetical protein